MRNRHRLATQGFAVAAAWIVVAPQSSRAGIVLTDTTHIPLAASQSETGGDVSENPDVTGGSTGIPISWRSRVRFSAHSSATPQARPRGNQNDGRCRISLVDGRSAGRRHAFSRGRIER